MKVSVSFFLLSMIFIFLFKFREEKYVGKLLSMRAHRRNIPEIFLLLELSSWSNLTDQRLTTAPVDPTLVLLRWRYSKKCL